MTKSNGPILDRAVLIFFEGTIAGLVLRDFTDPALDFVDGTDFKDFLECDLAGLDGVLFSSESRRLGLRLCRPEALARGILKK